MLVEQIIEFELRGLGTLDRTYTPTTGYFYDNTKNSDENLWVNYNLLLKYCERQCTLLNPTDRPNHTKLKDAQF